MRAGSLDRQIIIQQAEITVSDAGTPKPTWSTFRSVWAQVLQFNTEDRDGGRGSASEQSVTFRIYYLDSLSMQHRVIYGGSQFQIKSIKEIGRRVGLDLICDRQGS